MRRAATSFIAWLIFFHYLAPIVRVRSYACPSSRQAATPDIPRSRYIPDTTIDEGRTFGVVLDTSGSMDSDFSQH